MPTPLEDKIANDFALQLRTVAETVPEELANKLIEIVQADGAVTADRVLELVKRNVGDQPV